MRLRAAESAVRDGRLDEAYRIVASPDLRENKKAAGILANLAEKLYERARQHFRADRFSEALIDLDRASTAGVLTEQIAELRAHVQAVAVEERRKDTDREDRVREAARRMHAGSLAAGQRILEQASEGDLAANQLRAQAEHRAGEIKALLDQAGEFIHQGQPATAVLRLKRAKTIEAHHPDVARLEAALCKQVLERAWEALNQGKFIRCLGELAPLGALGDTQPSKRELDAALMAAQETSRCMRAGQFADARRHVLTLQRMAPGAAWIKGTLEQLRQMDEVYTQLMAGPLGEPAKVAVSRAAAPKQGRGLDETIVVANPSPKVQGHLSSRLLVLVDGGGSYLLLRDPRATIGRAASNDCADIPILSDLAERHANLLRVEEDYFIESNRDLEINGRVVRSHLLREGDRVVLGRKGKFSFRMPSRQSLTAALDLSDGTKMPNDVRRVLLFNQYAVLGNGSSAHIRCMHAGTPLVLFERNGDLWLRPKATGHVMTDAAMIRLGEPVEMNGVRLVVEAWRVRSPAVS